MNQISPDMMAQAHILGQGGQGRRTPTKAEMAKYRSQAITETILQVSSTVLTSAIQGGVALTPEEAVGVAKELIEESTSESRKTDMSDDHQRSLRNQTAATLVFSALQSGRLMAINDAYDEAAKLVEASAKYAKESLEKAD